MRLRRAVSSISSGRACRVVEFRGHQVKNLFRIQEEVLDSALLIAMCPFLAAGHKSTAPLPMMVVVMVQVCESAEHRNGV
jgi:hypothetical protein